MDAARPALRPFFRCLAWLMAALLFIGMAAMVFVLIDEAPPPRELAFFVASLLVMSIFLWGCVRAAVARATEKDLVAQARGTRSWRVMIALYALSLIVVLLTMLEESGSVSAWAGLLVMANLAGCALYLFRRPSVSGR